MRLIFRAEIKWNGNRYISGNIQESTAEQLCQSDMLVIGVVIPLTVLIMRMVRVGVGGICLAPGNTTYPAATFGFSDNLRVGLMAVIAMPVRVWGDAFSVMLYQTMQPWTDRDETG